MSVSEVMNARGKGPYPAPSPLIWWIVIVTVPSSAAAGSPAEEAAIQTTCECAEKERAEEMLTFQLSSHVVDTTGEGAATCSSVTAGDLLITDDGSIGL